MVPSLLGDLGCNKCSEQSKTVIFSTAAALAFSGALAIEALRIALMHAGADLVLDGPSDRQQHAVFAASNLHRIAVHALCADSWELGSELIDAHAGQATQLHCGAVDRIKKVFESCHLLSSVMR